MKLGLLKIIILSVMGLSIVGCNANHYQNNNSPISCDDYLDRAMNTHLVPRTMANAQIATACYLRELVKTIGEKEAK